MPRLLRSALVTTLLLSTPPVNAGTVAIVQPPNATPELTETVSRLHGELISVGLEVKMIEPGANRRPDGTDARAWVEGIAAGGGIDALIDVVGNEAPVWVDVWVIEKSPRRVELWRVAGEPDTPNAPERLAIRAIEVLRSSFLVNDMSGQQRHHEAIARPAIAAPPRRMPDETTRHTEQVGIGLGAAVLASTNIGPAILPVVHIDGTLGTRLRMQLELAGFGSRPTVAAAAGDARVAQQYGILGSSYRLSSDQDLSPFVALSVGALHTSVQGEADAPRQGHDASQWSFLLDGSVGAVLHLPGRYYVSLAGHVQLAEPYVAIHIMDAVAATSGQPNFLITLIVGAWL